MDSTPELIQSDIRKTRAELHTNLEELEHKVKAAIDWRQLFAKNPGTMTAAAFGVGALLSTMIRRSNRSPSDVQDGTRGTPAQIDQRVASNHKPHGLQSWDNIKNAMVGLAAAKVTGYLRDRMPGFEEQLQKSGHHHEGPVASSTEGANGPLL